MATRKSKNGDDDQKDEPRKPHKEQRDAVKIHEAYLQHRLGGGEPASPEAYRRAVEAFEKLPGALRSTPASVPPKEPKKTPEPKADEAGGEGEAR
jgi:hypothetical protein